jgi:hypothetical protein
MFLLDTQNGEANDAWECTHRSTPLLSPIWWIERLPATISVTAPPVAHAIEGPPRLLGNFLKRMPSKLEVDEAPPIMREKAFDGAKCDELPDYQGVCDW